MVGQGMFWGNLIGIGLCALQQHYKFISLNPTYYYTNYVPIAWDWRVILGLNLLTLVVATHRTASFHCIHCQDQAYSSHPVSLNTETTPHGASPV